MATNLKPVGEVSQLCVYPVKSTYVLNVSAAECTEVGLYLPEINVCDRQYCVLMPNGKAASMREYSKLTLIKPNIQNGTVCLDAPGLPTLQLPKCSDELKGDTRKVDVLEQLTEGVDCGDEAGEWVSKHLNKIGARIVCFSGIGNKRTLEDAGHILKIFDMNKPQENPKLSFPEIAPYALLSEESVADLNNRLENPVSAKNFRPNIVIKGCKAHEEDNFGKVKIGSAEFSSFTEDPRCSVTAINPETGVRYPHFEPLKTLRAYRPIKEVKGVKWPVFAVYMVLTKAGEIKVGDTVYKIE